MKSMIEQISALVFPSKEIEIEKFKSICISFPKELP